MLYQLITNLSLTSYIHTHTNTLNIGWLLAAFFLGYVLTQIPGGWLAQRFGAKYILGVGIVMTAVFTLFTPIAANVSVWLLAVVRMLEGVFEVSRLDEINHIYFLMNGGDTVTNLLCCQLSIHSIFYSFNSDCTVDTCFCSVLYRVLPFLLTMLSGVNGHRLQRGLD